MSAFEMTLDELNDLRADEEHLLTHSERCESPVERSFFGAMNCAEGTIVKAETLGWVFHTQYVEAPYRLDFAFTHPDGQKLCVEVDGFEFHSSKGALMRDRQRDRDLHLRGWRVVRFAGIEVYRRSVVCSNEVWLHLQQMRPPSKVMSQLATSIAKAQARLEKNSAEREIERAKRIKAQREARDRYMNRKSL